MDFNKIKKDFPIFDYHKKKNIPFVYLNNAAGKHKPQTVIDTTSQYYSMGYASVNRGLYDLSEQTTERYEQVRQKVAHFINARSSEEIIFTKGTTESINFVAQTWVMEHIKTGDEILISQVEHHANLIPWRKETYCRNKK